MLRDLDADQANGKFAVADEISALLLEKLGPMDNDNSFADSMTVLSHVCGRGLASTPCCETHLIQGALLLATNVAEVAKDIRDGKMT